ncbi:hypothetical protein ABZ567_30745 [Streptomyces sp. NPDC016459]|uniref:hypothetical protein n=1 Tax=Streptomyces sp. NPDC016459 TaxID=3157190 RepID=UPI0033D68884
MPQTPPAVFRTPYVWSRMNVRSDGSTITYTSGRRRLGPRGAHSAISVAVGEPDEEPSARRGDGRVPSSP